MSNHNHLKYPNLTIFFSILFFTTVLSYTGTLHVWVENLGAFGYLSVVIAGIFFVSTFTVIPATAILILLSTQFNLFLVSFLAGTGAMIGDFLIFRFVRDGLVDELKNIFNKVGGENVLKFHYVIHTKYFAWLGPVLGAIIIASPFPDELGVGFLGVYKLNDSKFAIISFILNTLGIFFILTAAQVLI